MAEMAGQGLVKESGLDGGGGLLKKLGEPSRKKEKLEMGARRRLIF